MKKLLLFLLAAVMVFSLAACGGNGNNPSGNNSTPGTSQGQDEYAKEFEILVGSSEKWTPFHGKTDVKFQVSDEYVLSINHNGTEVEFKGEHVGVSTIFAFSGDEQLKTLVNVIMAQGNNGTGEKDKGLFIENINQDIVTCYIVTEKITGETQAITAIRDKNYVGVTEPVTVPSKDDIFELPWATRPPADTKYYILAEAVWADEGRTEYYCTYDTLYPDNGENKPWGLFVEIFPGT